VWEVPIRRYRREDIFIRSYSFFRRAAEAGPVITFAARPNLLVPWRGPESVPGLELAFERGLLYPFPGAISYYQYEQTAAAAGLAAEASRAGAEATYENAVAHLSHCLLVPHLEIAASQDPFGWWKRRLAQTSPVEQLIRLREGLDAHRGQHHEYPGLNIRYDVLRMAITAVPDHIDLDTWNVILRAFDFQYVSERYWDDRPSTRILKEANANLTPDEATMVATDEVNRLKDMA
jgi:hypothetical protein